MPKNLGLHRLPLSKKINIAILSTTILALVMAGLAIVVYELTSTRQAVVDNLTSVANLVATNSTGALAFQDNAAANRLLVELKDHRTITCARIYTKNGQPFATYTKANEPQLDLPQHPQDDGQQITFSDAQIFLPIEFKGDRIGTIYMKSSMARVYQRLGRYSVIMTIVILVLIPVAYVVSNIFQRFIATPIMDLAAIAKDIAERKDYSVRARLPEGNWGDDEVGQLTATFNHMLETIESREENLVHQAEELGRSNQDLEQFAYISSHDLQEPLRKVSTYAQLLQEQHKSSNDADTARYVAQITGSAARMRTLIQDVLAYSQLNKPDVADEQVNLTDVVKHAVTEMDESLKQKNTVVQYDSLPTVRANPSQMYQLFQNLLSNAAKFNRRDRPTIRIFSFRQNNEWIISVQDNGIGIAPKYHQMIFKVFQRLNKREEFAGTGIGLAICKKIVERLGGHIWVDSDVNKGATFSFSLPVP